ncbi:MAG: 23S rRNA (guanine2445-N2)-methyltransferase / 23S rRNA (guanine2069-N7)-methyltransferase [Reinekea sp.]|jgi:23S rRNA (guanine2445-N2)-methyltransferase / 23S rRNA (guanine2069-N7)-methyltransferase|uniref:bifunctional 23S rRNA (guanine(2069)-N(7))-methyltransferase RlmK/23S rRNA (guanine(2445)-N(2))-methyltransferase RlmL n=1 Tax=Reinekea sp. TaxID=1970455 RepID=UPI003989B9FC
MTAEQTFTFWMTCPQGVHGLLKKEIEAITGIVAGDWNKGVQFVGPLEAGYRVCLWSRLANRVFLGLNDTVNVSYESLQSMIQAVDWDEHVRPTGTLKVSFGGRLPEIRDSRFGAQKVKDWVVDQFRDKHGTRPSVDNTPDLTIYVQIAKKRMFLGVELTGDSLHKRGYRQATGPAPIKENLAAALLFSKDWSDRAKQGESFLDLMCGSGTIVIEAALMAADYAPGLLRQEYAFERWLLHDAILWNNLIKEARERRTVGLENMPSVLGYDADGGVIEKANETLVSLGVSKHARCYQKNLDEWTLPTHWSLKPGLWVSNPPYGERLGDKPTLMRFYRTVGDIARSQLSQWSIGMLTSDDILAREIGLRPALKRNFYNGPIEAIFYSYEANETRAVNTVDVNQSEQTQALTNRVAKNLKQLKKLIKKDQLEAYRVYDADIPEFAIAVDKYGDWLHVQEYAPPKTIPEEKAQARLLNAVEALATYFEIPVSQVVVKRRERQRGTNQYEKKGQTDRSFTILEQGVKLKVNLHDYLDSGLFLDHRPSRQWVQENAEDISFLNLFCYTGSFTSHAFKGGAKKTVSVDLSKTYLKWAEDNLELNGGRAGPNHQFVHADVMKWLKETDEMFDLIVMDPPTFSNSARMSETLDIQRDHSFLVSFAMKHLNEGGLLLFSNNYRQFKISDKVVNKFDVRDISAHSVPADYKRKQPHVCFEIRHKED